MKTNKFEVSPNQKVFWITKRDYDSFLSVACGSVRDYRHELGELVIDDRITPGSYDESADRNTVFTTLESLKAYLFDLGCQMLVGVNPVKGN